jgi:Cu/Ag efflux protein CusF
MQILKLAMSAAISFGLSSVAMAETYTKGVVEKIDAKGKKLTIAHEELKDLDMPAMTMVFRVGDDSMLEKLTEGAQIEFVAERVDGKLTVTRIK